MKFATVRDDDYEIRLESKQPMTDSDWPVWFYIRLEYMEQHMSDRELKEFGGRYHVSICVVAPDAVSDENKARALEFCGAPIQQPDVIRECLLEYGIQATLFQKIGNNKRALLCAARKELQPMLMLFGFYMDKPLNRIGNSGWDFIKGEIGFH